MVTTALFFLFWIVLAIHGLRVFSRTFRIVFFLLLSIYSTNEMGDFDWNFNESVNGIC